MCNDLKLSERGQALRCIMAEHGVEFTPAEFAYFLAVCARSLMRNGCKREDVCGEIERTIRSGKAARVIEECIAADDEG